MITDPKTAKRRGTLTPSVSMEVRSAIRAFLLAHRDGYTGTAVRDLILYINAYHKISLTPKDVEALIMKEMKGIAVEMKAMHMEEDLFSPSDTKRKINLGSCFCPVCSKFKNYKKECPHCGNHEMTV
ncbi:MAG: hypothetical protein JXA22_10915 [Candidatus Thermoplasmatota archaeon]|nr:hypothetical protein [Candidatus Thermoplasmatota archaeon]